MLFGNDSEIKDLEDQHKICSAMYDEELEHPENIHVSQHAEIGQTCGLEASLVADLLKKWKQMSDFHKFLLDRRERGDPMPETRDELLEIYKIEKPDFLMKHNKRSPFKRISNKQRKFAMRYHRV